jgi:hypothetical protein
MSYNLRKFLSENQIEFTRTERTKQGILFLTDRSESLEVHIKNAGPQVNQLLILAPNPSQPVESFIQQCQAITNGFQNVWQLPQAQIIGRDACVRYLFQSRDDHAFRFLWENRLKQKSEDMRMLNRAVLGGGLRFVMPPDQNNQTQVELKIESYLSDSKMLFVELQYAWPFPVNFQDGFKPKVMITEIQEYCDNHVLPFILGS